MSESIRTRIWSTLVYPDSAPENWLDIIDNLNITVLVSPLHKPEGDAKKEHYHIILFFDGVKSFNQVQNICNSFNDGVLVKPVNSKRNAIRYLIHKDNKNKIQYSKDEIKIFGDFNIEPFFTEEDGEKIELKEILVFARSLKIHSLKSLVDYIIDNDTNIDLQYIVKNAYFFNTYLKEGLYYDRYK